MTRKWWSNLARRKAGRSPCDRAELLRRWRRSRPTLENLEDRTVPVSAAPRNVLVNDLGQDQNTRQDTQSETTLVTFTHQSRFHVAVAFNDSGSNVRNEKQFTGWSLSDNGGNSFTDQGELPVSGDGDAGDPVFARHE